MATPTFAASTEPAIFGDPELRADGDLVCMAFDTEGVLRTLEEPGVVRSWDVAGGTQRSHDQLSDLETLWAMHPAGRLLAGASSDLSIWDANGGRLVQALAQPSWVNAVAFAADPSLVATGHDDGLVCIWNVATGTLVREISVHSTTVSCVAFSLDGQILASSAEDKTIQLTRLSDGEKLLELVGHSDRIPALLWHPRGDWLMSAGWDSSARVWDARTGKLLILLNGNDGQVVALGSDSTGKVVATADSSGGVCVWDSSTWKRTHMLRISSSEVRCVAMRRDGKLLACAGGDRLIQVWDLEHSLPLSSSATAAQANASAGLSGDGSRLVSNGQARGCRVWEVATRRSMLALAANEPIDAVAISADGRWIAGAADRFVRTWHGADGGFYATLPDHEEKITRLAFSPDSTLLAAASTLGLGVWIWEMQSAQPELFIPDALDGCAVQALAWHPQGNLLAVGGIDWMATGGSDGAISLWDLANRCEIATFGGGTTCLAFHPEGLHLAAGSLDQTIQIWNTASQEVVLDISGHEGPVNSIAYSPDGRLLASGGDDCTLRIWDTLTGEHVLMREITTQIKVVCYSPDGRKVFTANGNGTCQEFSIS